MTAGLIAMEHFDRPAVERLNGLAERAMRGIEAEIARTGIGASVTGCGSMFRVHLKPEAPRNYREAFLDAEGKKKLTALLDHLFDSGFIMVNTCTAILSTPMTEVEMDTLVEAMGSGFEKLVAMG